MSENQLHSSERAYRLVASLLIPSTAPLKDYLRAADYCNAVMNYTDDPHDREYMAQWRAAFAALMVAADQDRPDLLRDLRRACKTRCSPLPRLPGQRVRHG